MAIEAKDADTGLRWVNGDRLRDLDFADEIALLDNTWRGMKDITSKTQAAAAKVGLAINPEKRKIMKVGKWTEDDTIEDREVEFVDALCYLGSLMTADTRCNREIKICIG